jgi:hypothetical protein
MKLRYFKLLIFYIWLEALNFDDKFLLGLLKKNLGLKFFFFFGPINFFFFLGGQQVF